MSLAQTVHSSLFSSVFGLSFSHKFLLREGLWRIQETHPMLGRDQAYRISGSRLCGEESRDGDINCLLHERKHTALAGLPESRDASNSTNG